MTEKKVTKREKYEAIRNFVETGVLEVVTKEEIAEFCTKEIEALDKKAAKAKETAAKKKSEIDRLAILAAEALTDEFEVVATITERIDFEGVSPQKVVYRLNKLAENGQVEKGELSVGGGEGQKARKLVAFRKLQEA